MSRLLTLDEFASLTAFFAILILEQTGGQVIQSATARLVAQHAAHGDDPALHSFVRRWTTRILLLGGIPALVIVVLAPFVRVAAFSPFAVATLGMTVFFAAVLTFTLGLLQGLGRFGWFGNVYIAIALTRLAAGVALVVLFSQLQVAGLRPVHGALMGAGAALAVGAVGTVIPLAPLFRAARGTVHEIHVARSEVRFFLLAAVIFLAYAALTFIDGLIAPLRIPAEAGDYAAAITMAKVILFAPIAVGFILLERTANADALGRDPDRYLFASLGFVFATSGAVALAYLVAPAFFTDVIVGPKYTLTASLIGPYSVAALSNALLSLWVAYFVGRGMMGYGLLLAIAVALELAFLVIAGRDAATMVRIVVTVSVAMQAAAIIRYGADRLVRRRAIA